MTLGFFWIIALCFFDQFQALIPDDQGKRFYRAIYTLFVCVILFTTARIFAEHAVACGYNLAARGGFPRRDQPGRSRRKTNQLRGAFWPIVYSPRRRGSVWVSFRQANQQRDGID